MKIQAICPECQGKDENCQQCCDHEFDPSEGGMCINCGREDYYNFIDEDRGSDR